MVKKQQDNATEKQFFIPMEIITDEDKEFARAHGYTEQDVRWWKIGAIPKRAILILCEEEVYRAYMRPIWREMKAKERLKAFMEENGIVESSYEHLVDEYNLEIVDTDMDLDKKLLLSELKELQEGLESTLDKKIIEMVQDGYSEKLIAEVVGVSQKTVNNHKNKIFEEFREYFSK